MSPDRRRKTLFAAPATMLIAVALAALAHAAVTVYQNDFSNRAEFQEIVKSGGGKACDRSYRSDGDSVLITVNRGDTTCSLRPPVQGDSELPDHDVRVLGKILDKTAKSARGGAFLEISVRSGGGGVGYSLRVFPQRGRFELVRGPGGGGDFPAAGTDEAIAKVDKRNELRLVARGAEVSAFVNGDEIARVTDADPGQVTGQKIRFGVGNAKDSSKDVFGTVKEIRVAVP
jgi:hypothetical protein